MKFEEEFFSKDDLLDRDCLSPMVNNFYGDQKFVTDKRSKEKMVGFCSKNKIFQIEKAKRFGVALKKRRQTTIESKNSRLNKEINAAFNWCFNFKIEMVGEDIDWIEGFASYQYNQEMYQKTGIIKPGPEENWADCLNSQEFIEIVLRCIKYEMSNFGDTLDYIKNLNDKAVSSGCEFKSYAECLWILNLHFTKTFKKVYPDFESYCLKIVTDSRPWRSDAL